MQNKNKLKIKNAKNVASNFTMWHIHVAGNIWRVFMIPV